MEAKTTVPGFWDDTKSAQALLSQINRRKAVVNSFNDTYALYEDGEAATDLALDDPDFLKEAEKAVAEFVKELDELELSLLLSGDYDANDAMLTIHAGTGGLEAQDWADMLLRMYTRWTERRHYKVEIADIQPADEGGIKSATILVNGLNAYGYLKSERGVHRLVRMSPYDTASRRQTSFASVDVMPQVGEESEIEIPPDEIRIDTYRSTGKGGQKVNKTDSAVRITHIPTGIVVSCQNERSQFQNKDVCMQMLQARLLDKRIKEREAELAALRGVQQEIGWGSQIRSYVFNPYQLVKDHRTNYETGNTAAVMDGDLDAFINAYLHMIAIGNK